MLHLEPFQDAQAQLVYNMANRGEVYPLNESVLAPLRSKKPTIFDKGAFDSPILSGIENLPLDALPTPQQTQNLLTAGIGGPNSFRLAPSHGIHELDAQATIDLLANIPNPSYSAPGAIIHMASPTFDRLRTRNMPWARDGILGQASFEMTVAPAGEVFDLAYSPFYYFPTLLTGTKIWLAYPPRHGNLLTLQRRYTSLAGQTAELVFMSIVNDLKHGIVILQKAGETLMLPPFWSYISIDTSTSVSAAYNLATATKFMERLLSIDLQVAAVLMWPEQKDQQVKLVDLIETLARHLHRILNDPPPSFRAENVVKDICANWDRVLAHAPEQGSLKAQVSRLCKIIEDVEERTRVERIWQQAWLWFLDEKRKKPECRLCHVRLQNMSSYGTQGVASLEHRLMAYFVAEHWVAGA